jgi:hypothetical protein
LLCFSPDKAALRFGILGRNMVFLKKRSQVLEKALKLALGENWYSSLNKSLRKALDKDSSKSAKQAIERAIGMNRDIGRSSMRENRLDEALDRARIQALQLLDKKLPDYSCTFWAFMLANSEIGRRINEFLCEIINLRPAPLWNEVLSALFVPTVPKRILLANPSWWSETLQAFKSGKPAETDIYAASCQLMLDGMLYVVGYHKADASWLRQEMKYSEKLVEEHKITASPAEKILFELAQETRQFNHPPLCIAHCLRDLCYGNKNRIDELATMVNSEDSPYREIFIRRYWCQKENDSKS